MRKKFSRPIVKTSLIVLLVFSMLLPLVACGGEMPDKTDEHVHPVISMTTAVPEPSDVASDMGIGQESVTTTTVTSAEELADESLTESASDTTTNTKESAAEVPVEPPHEHNYAEEIISEVSCETSEIKRLWCECGEEKEEVTIKAYGHQYTITTIAPTYVTKGYDEYKCSVCGATYKGNYRDVLAHAHSYESTVIKPTCSAEGYTSYKCSLCGKTYSDEYTKKIAHVYVDTVIKPTCTEEGYTLHQCSCGVSFKDAKTNKIAHNYKNSKVVAPTCAEEGYTLQTCSMCNEEKKVSPTDKLPHTYGEYTSDKNATCEKDGTKTAVCSVCKNTTTVADVGSKLGHKLSDWKNSSTARHVRTCQNADCGYKEESTHDYTIEKRVEPTCVDRGRIELSCVCGRVGEVKEYIDALGHDYGPVKTIAPTYTEEGYDLETCNVCKEEKKSNIKPMVPHECTYDNIVTNPTCVDKGYTTHVCKICSDKKVDTYTEAIGHDYKQTIVEPTCAEEGYTKNTCSRCGDSYNDNKIDKIGHDYKTTIIEATTGWAGYDLHKCSVCGDSYKDNEKAQLSAGAYPKGYSDGTCTIVIYKEWYKNAYVYAAHITYSDYSRLWVECANGKYNSGWETTSHAANRIGAIFAVNGDYATPGNGAGGYAIARKGVVCNDRKTYPEGIYNSATGILQYGQISGIGGRQLSELVAAGLVTDTFQFGPAFLLYGSVYGDPYSSSRAQRTFIGTNGYAGDIWICVSDGRYNDGVSAGLNGYECASYLKSKGCTLGIPLDGGGSSTIYFNGSVLNAARGGQRSVADFLVFK